MAQPTIVEIYTDHYDSLHTEYARVAFLLNLKRMGSMDSLDALLVLGTRWINEPLLE